MEQRKKDHLTDYNDAALRSYNYKIYQAMRNYGIDNFIFEEIEQCEDCWLPEREKYYIHKYNSRTNGYNTTLGGKGKTLISDEEIETYKVLFDDGWMLKDIAKIFDSNPKTIGRKLREKYGINTKVNSINSSSKKVKAIKNETIIEFKSFADAARYIIQNNFTKSKNITSIISHIYEALDKADRSAYGFKWCR